VLGILPVKRGGRTQARKLFKFYDTLHRKTVPYSPQSHGLVENSNKYISQLLRLFAEQYRATWLDVIPLANFIANTLPKNILESKSPFFMFFGYEPLERNKTIIEFPTIDANEEKIKNNRNFARLLREVLLKKREKLNKSLHRPYKSFPKNTLIYVKIKNVRAFGKIKPMYEKAPEKIIKEYRSIVYSIDLAGRVKRHSKDNIRKAGERSLELFGNLPFSVQLIMGAPLDVEIWNQIKDTGDIPEYLKTQELQFEKSIVTRGQILADTHLFMDEDVPINDELIQGEDEDIEIGELFEGEVLEKLKDLHKENLLIDDDLAIDDIVKEVTKEKRSRNLIDIDENNIIEQRTRGKTVRFNLS
jgi:hypothetical protein